MIFSAVIMDLALSERRDGRQDSWNARSPEICGPEENRRYAFRGDVDIAASGTTARQRHVWNLRGGAGDENSGFEKWRCDGVSEKGDRRGEGQ